jgi:hypothetical protein
MPPNKLVADVKSESSECDKRDNLAQSGSVGGGMIQVFAEDIAESGICT